MHARVRPMSKIPHEQISLIPNAGAEPPVNRILRKSTWIQNVESFWRIQTGGGIDR